MRILTILLVPLRQGDPPAQPSDGFQGEVDVAGEIAVDDGQVQAIPEVAGRREYLGPADGPLVVDAPANIGVYLDGTLLPVGDALPVGFIRGRRGAKITAWKLEVRRQPLEGWWIVDRRTFVRLGDAAEVERG